MELVAWPVVALLVLLVRWAASRLPSAEVQQRKVHPAYKEWETAVNLGRIWLWRVRGKGLGSGHGRLGSLQG